MASAPKRKKYEQEVKNENNESVAGNQFTRSQKQLQEFDWKSRCFICGKICDLKHRSEWSEVTGSIDENSKMYRQVLEKAQEYRDMELFNRVLSTNGDLVAVEARYHRKKNCLAKKYSKYQKAELAKSPADENDPLVKACATVKQYFVHQIEQENQGIEFSVLKSKLTDILSEDKENIECHDPRRIKRVLSAMWPNIKFIPRPGLSDLVCSSNLTLDIALAKCISLERSVDDMKEQEECGQLFDSFIDENADERVTLNEAVNILRTRILKMTGLNKEYFSSKEVTLSKQKEFLDPLVLEFVYGLFGNRDDDDRERKVVSLSSDITYLVNPSIQTSKHLGLTNFLHHNYAKKNLIDDLNKHGYTLPYHEVRTFLTSAATYMITEQQKTPSGAVVPTCLPGNDDDRLLISVGDNWDHNECTLSGKGSTHAMTSILVSTSHATNSSPQFEPSRIPRVQERSLNTSSLPGGGLAHTLIYKKPAERPSPRLNPPVELGELNPTESDRVKILKMKELLYHMKRNQRTAFCDDRLDVDTETFPTWSVYQSKIETDSISEPVEIMYNPIIMANPTNLNTVYTTLKRTKEQIQALGQKVCPVVFDMGLLMKALEITWSNPSEFEGIIPIEGGMHYMMSVFGGIGHIYGDAGLKELLNDSDVFAKNTVDHILSGKDFDRALKALLMVDEVLNRRFMHQFRLWAKNEISVFNLDTQLQQLHLHDLPILQNGIPPELEQLIQLEIQPLIEKFRLEGRTVSPTFRFWDSYLTDVSMPMKLFLSSSRHAIWDVNKYAKTKLLPFLFSSNRSNYMKFMPYQVLAMNRLPEALSVCFEKGLFVSKLSRGRFNSVWYDYILEVTENKALKSSGGIIGITHNENALTRWFMSRPLTARYATEYSPRNVESQENTTDKHHSDSNFNTKVYNDGVNKMLGMFDDTFIDPFSLTCPPERLVNFASGVEASSEIEKSLLECHDQGKQMLENFVKQRLIVSNETNSTEKNFFEHMSRPNIKTMTNMNSVANTKSKVKLINGEEMYLRLLAINSYKKISVERVLSFENSHVPLSLFKDDGSMMSTKKSDFLSKLEHIAGSSCAVKTIAESADCVIYDAMGIVQMITPNPGATFFDVASAFWTYILYQSGNVASIHVVFDRYLPNSLKAATRQKRGEKSAINMPSVFRYNMLVPEWKKLLTSTQSKSQLTHLYTQYFTENCHTLLKEGQIVYVSGGFGKKILKVTCDTVLFHSISTQEEADTRMLLHLLYASKEEGVHKAIITSPDTDIFVILLHHFSDLVQFGVEQIYFKTGRKASYTDLTRLIPIHKVFEQLSPTERCILMSVYCLTGCDTCSSFHGVGKKKSFKVMRKNAELIRDLSQLGSADDITPQTKAAAIRFVALLYGYSNNQCCSLDTLRSRLVLKNVRTKPRKLPPTDDSFILHLYRCLYQLLVWRSALDPCPSLPDPFDYGYRLDKESGLYIPKMMNQAAAPPELLSDLVCSCKDLCGEECVCSLNEQPCTVACECKAAVDSDPCLNIFTVLASLQEDILE